MFSFSLIFFFFFLFLSPDFPLGIFSSRGLQSGYREQPIRKGNEKENEKGKGDEKGDEKGNEKENEKRNEKEKVLLSLHTPLCTHRCARRRLLLELVWECPVCFVPVPTPISGCPLAVPCVSVVRPKRPFPCGFWPTVLIILMWQGDEKRNEKGNEKGDEKGNEKGDEKGNEKGECKCT